MIDSVTRRSSAALLHLGIAPLIAAGLLMSAPSAAHAEGPEQLYEPGPAAGAWSLESNSQFGRGDRSHTLELFHGVRDGLALGVEIEAEAGGGEFALEEFGIGAIIGLNDKEALIHLATLLQVGVTTEGDFPQLEARLIGEHESGRWRILGNAIVRRVDADERGASLGYAVTVERSIGETVRLGVEASGQAVRLSGFGEGFERAHYAGPSVGVEFELGDERELELGLKYLRRLDGGDEFRDTVRLVAELEF